MDNDSLIWNSVIVLAVILVGLLSSMIVLSRKLKKVEKEYKRIKKEN